MHTLRPFLQLNQSPSSKRVLNLSRCLPVFARGRRVQHRGQHDKYGPHKEYFQIPGQEPKPDLTPYVREYQNQPNAHIQGYPQSSSASTSLGRFQASQTQISQPTPQVFSRVRRFIRSLLWFMVFLQLGVITGTALITWEYLSPPFEPGSPEEQELVEEILDALDLHPMVQDLRENEWVEVDAFTPDLQHGLKGRNLVHQVLGGNNSQGVFLKVFHHPAQEYTMLVLFFGFGVEGWPDVVHGGVIATLLQESLSKHLAHYYPEFLTTPDNMTKIDYKQPCKPGEVYGVLVAPSGRTAITAGNVHLTQLQMTSLLVQIEGAPVINSGYDIQSNTETHTVGIPTRGGQTPTYAVCQAEVKIIPKQLGQNVRAFEVGAIDDGGFARALDILKKRPEFQEPKPQPQTGEDDKKEE